LTGGPLPSGNGPHSEEVKRGLIAWRKAP